jgi:predicted TPR repeat methyltransferase
MSNPFSDDVMAAGYAAARPAVHPRVIARLRPWLGPGRVKRAADVGCGAGLSTRPLLALADVCVGFDPSEAMVRAARRVTPGATFVAAGAERMPLGAGAVDLLAAAGSLNYTAHLEQVWPEARRVLTRRGVLVVYDFSPGRASTDGPALGEWFTSFVTRYPYPSSQARPLSPEILAELAQGFEMARAETFDIALPMNADAYRAYMLTETNVQAATRGGIAVSDIEAWCADTLAPVFGDQTRDVRFSGYLAQLAPSR